MSMHVVEGEARLAAEVRENLKSSSNTGQDIRQNVREASIGPLIEAEQRVEKSSALASEIINQVNNFPNLEF